MKTVTNTAKMARENPSYGLALAFMGEKGIHEQETNGQKELVSSEVLPAKFNGGRREDFEAIGIVFGEPVEGDPLFVHATLPEGWKKVRTDHYLWSDIVDETGKKRCSIFFKNAFYDRESFMNICNAD